MSDAPLRLAELVARLSVVSDLGTGLVERAGPAGVRAGDAAQELLDLAAGEREATFWVGPGGLSGRRARPDGVRPG